MKRSKIFIIGKLSQKELNLFQKDLLTHAIQVALKIKNLGFVREEIETIAKNSIDRVLLTYKFGDGSGLGEMVKHQVLGDLRAEYEKAYPEKAHRVKWPDLTEKRPFEKLLETLRKVKTLPKTVVKEIFEEVNGLLTGRQQSLLATIYGNTSITYAEISKQFGARGVMTYREIKIVYSCLQQTLKFLEITL